VESGRYMEREPGAQVQVLISLVLPGAVVVWNAAREVLVHMRRPEILAPAGDRDSLAAALAAGADAVYLGLDDGFNARARAANFPSDRIAETAALVHRAGAKLYVTLNTLVFEPELPIVTELIRRVAAAGVDAVIVQDPAVVMLARAAGLEVHASTQMTASSPLAIELLKQLGIARVVVPRELSVGEIRAYKAGTDVELEVFVHGALCVAWSGQCLSSEAWGGRSANRGQCAQACRLPYELIVDGERRDLGDVAYLLSPKDLIALDVVPELAAAGVTSLKIEGRLKGPAYVATAVAQYRSAVDPAFETALPLDRAALEVAYSRGASHGFLAGADHQTLVEGRFPRHRGLPLGRVTAIDGDELEVVPDDAQRVNATRTEPVAGMGVVFDASAPELPEQGGPIFAAARTPAGFRLRFGNPGPDLSRVRVGDFVWINSDPRVTAAGARAAATEPFGRNAIALEIAGRAGEPLVVTATMRDVTATARSTALLQPARGAGITHELLADKLGALGGTPFRVGALTTAALDAGLHLPVSELKELRRTIVAELDASFDRPRAPIVEAMPSLPPIAPLECAPVAVPLCRDDAQLDAVLDAGAREVELDWMELVGLGRAVERARARGARVIVATVRVQKPGEERIDAHLAKLEPDGVLVRSWGSLAFFQTKAIELHGDFSLNVTNSMTASWVLGKQLATITAAHDLDRAQLAALLANVPRGRVAVTAHHHIPTFHTEHCVYAHLLSDGRDYKTCGRPCEQHRIALRDRVGLVHPVSVDVGCRNTVFNAQAQSAASLVPELLATGVRRFRVELVRESASEAARLYRAYAALVAGTGSIADALAAASAHEQFGVTRGTMRTLTVL
jgi:U32 family peptidase